MGTPDAIPVAKYPQAIAFAIALRHSWRPDHFKEATAAVRASQECQSDVKYAGLDASADEAYYLPSTQRLNQPMYLVVRSALPAEALAPLVQREVRSVDPDVVISDAGTLDRSLRQSVARPRVRASLVSLFAGAALLLAAVGVYGVVAYSVAQRTRELGIRIALGARRREVLQLVMGRGIWLAGTGIAIGLLASFAFSRLLNRLLFATSPTDPLAFGLASALLLAVVLVASFAPALRATRIDPVVARRNE